ncbi:MAG TPA: GNAT family protein [Saprospiraceae bacterium]|nr:GNAT family protein [Saprospiraceae bacterium]
MIKGKRVYLRLFEIKDASKRAEWMNDPELREMLNSPYPVSEYSTKEWVKKMTLDPSRIDFAICMIETDKLIGYTGFRDIDLTNNKAESYTGIGEKKHWEKGFAQESKKIALDYIFSRYNLNKVYAKIRKGHLASIKLNRSLGYTIDGTMRQDLFSHGKYRDMVIMSILREEFASLKNGENE